MQQKSRSCLKGSRIVYGRLSVCLLDERFQYAKMKRNYPCRIICRQEIPMMINNYYYKMAAHTSYTQNTHKVTRGWLVCIYFQHIEAFYTDRLQIIIYLKG